MKIRFWSCVLAISFCLTARAEEFRALWVDAWGAGFLNSSQVTQLVDNCRQYNFNAIVVQMRRRGDAFYMPLAPNGDPRTTALAAGYDALADLINQCHSGNPRIEVHCWVVANLIWSDSTKAPSQPDHVFNSHPEFLMKSSTGATYLSAGYFLDPGNPEAMQWNYNMARDIVSRYDIDGFQWDYIRYPTTDSGYNEVAIARYNAEFELTGQPSPSDTQFSHWRRRQVTDFVRWTSADLLELNPNLQISAAVFASRSDAYNARFQDWATWNNEGIIDLCLPMNYTTDNAIFNARVDDAFNNEGVRRIYMGQGAYLNTKENTVTQLLTARNKPFLGTVFYNYRVPNSGTVAQIATFTYVRDNYQPTWQNTPALPWKTNPAKGIIKGRVTLSSSGEPLYNAIVAVDTATTRTQQTESHGAYAFFEVDPGTYNLRAHAAGYGSGSATATVTAGQVVSADIIVSAIDDLPPVISQVLVSSATESSAVISWRTDERANSTVEYGLSTAFGSVEHVVSLTTRHLLQLQSLQPASTYYFRVSSQDLAGNSTVSQAMTFSTLDEGRLPDIIIDNPAVTIAGTWSTGTGATDKFGSDYRFKSQGSGAAHLTYRPNISTSGGYQVYEWHNQGSNRTTNAPITISYAGGNRTHFVNQKSSGGRWNALGSPVVLNAGTTGFVRIADNFPDAGQVVIADAIKFVYVPKPPAPASVTATALNPSEIQLAWSDNATDETAYIVARSEISGGPYSDVATLPANTTTFVDSGLTENTTYYYVVRSTNISGTSRLSAEASARTPLPPPPGAPADLTATGISTSEIELSWTDTSTNEANFIVARATEQNQPFSEIATLGPDVTSIIDTNLQPDTTYIYVVRASNSGGVSEDSAPTSATTLPFPPVTPADLQASGVSASEIALSWTDNSNNEEHFVLGRATASGGPYSEVFLPPDRQSFIDNGLSPDTTYFYVIRAVNRGGTSSYSDEINATTLPLPPEAPSQLTAVATGTSQITLLWLDNAANEESCVVYRSITAGGPYISVATLGADSTSYTDTNLTENTSYYYVVQAENRGGASAYSNEASATTPTLRLVNIDEIVKVWVKTQNNKYRAKVTVKIVDENGLPVDAAEVLGDFTGAIEETGLHSTKTTIGQATFTSNQEITSGKVVFTVKKIFGLDLEYDARRNKTDASVEMSLD